MKRQDRPVATVSKIHDAKRRIGVPINIPRRSRDGKSYSDLPTNSAYFTLTSDNSRSQEIEFKNSLKTSLSFQSHSHSI
jgi:hypothetical protein